MALKSCREEAVFKKFVVAGGLTLSLMAGFAQAQTSFLAPRTSVDLSTVEWASTPTSTNYSSTLPGAPLSPQTYGSPTVSSANLFTWSASNVGAHSAYASTTPAMQTLRSSIAVSSVGGTEYDGTLNSAFQGQQISIGAGTSGLAAGAPVTLNFMLHLGGTMAVGNSSYPPGAILLLPSTYGYAASASALLNYEVYALGQDSPTVAFHYEGYASYGYSQGEYSDTLTDTFSSQGRYSTDGTWNWTDLSTNDAYDHTVSPVPLAVGPGSPGSRRVHVINTGLFTLAMNAHVGDTFEILGSLSTEAKAWGDLRMTAMSDFGSTFDADISSTTPGIEITGIQAGIAPVPEPEGYAMLLAGLGLLGFVARRRQRVAQL
jgi:hypothetical protein